MCYRRNYRKNMAEIIKEIINFTRQLVQIPSQNRIDLFVFNEWINIGDVLKISEIYKKSLIELSNNDSN